MSVGLAGAFLGGVLTLLSPCSVLLLPAFFSYAFSSAGVLVARTGVFYLGLLTTLVPLGMLAGSLGAVISANRSTLVVAASALIIVLGAVQLLGIPLPVLGRLDGQGGASALSVYVLGTVYGMGSVCAGPILGAVLTLAAVSQSALYGGIVLLVFAAGMVLPLLALAFFWDRLPGLRDWLRPRQLTIGTWSNAWASVVGGAVTILLGVLLILTDGTLALPSVLDSSQQMGLESQVLASTAAIPDAAIVGGAVLVLVGVYLLHRFTKRQRPTPQP
jgi:cytochrome c-type biogenesis protein